MILAVDPGHEKSAFVLFDPEDKQHPISEAGFVLNDVFLAMLDSFTLTGAELVLEGIECFGMAVGMEVLETDFWIGRFFERWGRSNRKRLFRSGVKLHLCRSARATDSNVRCALLNRYGPGKDKAVGTKKAPGPLYGIIGHCWSALAIAVTAAELSAACEEATSGGEPTTNKPGKTPV